MSLIKLPDEKNIGCIKVFDQSEAENKGGCSAYAIGGCLNDLGILINPLDLWNEVLLGPAKAGSRWVVGAINYVKKKGLISSSRSLKGINDILISINKGRPIILETHNINFRETNKSLLKIAVFDDTITTKHVRRIVGYSKFTRLITCRNSWGLAWGDNGNFYIKFEDLGKLGAMYSLSK